MDGFVYNQFASPIMSMAAHSEGSIRHVEVRDGGTPTCMNGARETRQSACVSHVALWMALCARHDAVYHHLT